MTIINMVFDPDNLFLRPQGFNQAEETSTESRRFYRPQSEIIHAEVQNIFDQLEGHESKDWPDRPIARIAMNLPLRSKPTHYLPIAVDVSGRKGWTE